MSSFLLQVIADSQREYNGPHHPDSGSGGGGGSGGPSRGSSLSESSTHTVLVIYEVARASRL